MPFVLPLALACYIAWGSMVLCLPLALRQTVWTISARGRHKNMEPQAIWYTQVREGDTKVWNPKLSRQAVCATSARGRHKTMEPQAT